MINFPVDAVPPAMEPLPTRPLGSLYPDALWTAGDPALPVLEPDGIHPLLGAVARAFADHRPLTLSPDAVWLTILEGVARHIHLNADDLRDRLVGHQGRDLLTVVVRGEPVWPDVVAKLAGMLPSRLGASDCDFSTSTEVDRMAGRVVLMDAYSPYFAYRVSVLCGIPSISLTGTAEDWRRIRARVDVLAGAGLGLEKWCRSLAPIADHFVRAAAGAADPEFWKRIYNPIDAYGGDKSTGWITRLYPYVGESGSPNPLLDLPLGEPRNATGPGVSTDAVRATLARVRMLVENAITGEQTTVALHAGLTAVVQEPGGSLRPISGCHLTAAGPELDDVLDRLDHEGEMDPPGHPALLDLPEVAALYRRFGSGVLFGGAWRLRVSGTFAEFQADWWVAPVFDLADGRSVCVVKHWESAWSYWIAVPWASDRTIEDPADVRVYGTSLAALLEGALDTGGDLTHLDSGSLSQYLAM
ncbi:hypothetical protein ACWT_6305 [Actinoplanes sp. SE50]|uniref:DUF4419 domain-containing protein n=1 Tax=unclassified Actinoplanes TaxID=2626549 RepID=UPI00023ED4DB|nr:MULTISPECIES: DUF4419 domain-containing protein [unclassified Actinoplanes]AEV87320.1 uncharacterized protein ACPL_6438 [Actinoplanes sp. SE50/110]ATO85720.1 hypothetical protein ACWT_6305 [Actinoplanes sp. SE50]SLM03133.1 hypothetical protein ACSP50_6422 [Actinoplanes sp. SE50/110]